MATDTTDPLAAIWAANAAALEAEIAASEAHAARMPALDGCDCPRCVAKRA